MAEAIESIQELAESLNDFDGNRSVEVTFGRMTFSPENEKRVLEVIAMARANGAVILYSVENNDNGRITWVRFSFNGSLNIFRWMLNELDFIGA